MDAAFHGLAIATRPSVTSGSVVTRWAQPLSTPSETFRPISAWLAPPAPAPVQSELQAAFERAEQRRREADWERFVIVARAWSQLSPSDWAWIWGRLAHADQLGFHAGESIARVVVAHAREPVQSVAAFVVLARLSKHPSDAVKAAALEAAAELDVVIAKWLAARVPRPVAGPLGEVVQAIEAMTR